MDNRTTSEVITKLGDDIEKCHKSLILAIDNGVVDDKGEVAADYEYHARQLIRAIFAFIESVTFSIKVHAAGYCLDNDQDISYAERYFATDIEHKITDNGKIIERKAHISLSSAGSGHPF